MFLSSVTELDTLAINRHNGIVPGYLFHILSRFRQATLLTTQSGSHCTIPALLETNLTILSNARFRSSSGKGSSGQLKSPTASSPGGQADIPDHASHASKSSANIAPRLSPLPNSPSLAQTIGMEEPRGSLSTDDVISSYHLPRPFPLWLNGQYTKHIVKGNFMTLSARPKTVEPGEWIAHQGTVQQ